MKQIFLIIGIVFLSGLPVMAQDSKLPAGIDELFSFQYPYATDVKCEKNGAAVFVDFTMLNEIYQAVYENGNWRFSAKEMAYNHFPSRVQQGFRNSRFGNSKILETSVIYYSSGLQEYRLKINLEDLNTRYLYFNENGRLLRATANEFRGTA